MSAIVEMKGVSKTFYRGKEAVNVLQNLDLEVGEGAYEALMGPSGSGKSTLLNLIAGLDKPTSGTAKVAGQELSQMSDSELAKFRSSKIGFIFQAYNLLPVLTALENVELPLLLTNLGSAERKKRAMTAVVVTHDIHGAKAFSDFMLLLDKGKIVAQGTFEELKNSKDDFVVRFLDGEAKRDEGGNPKREG